MSIGTKIKEYRGKFGLTQKDLAEKLFVTFQAVSRWENDEVEPSIDTIKEMAKLFGCTPNELMGFEDTTPKEEVKPEVVEKVVYKEPKPVLGICEHCNKPIFEGDDLNRVEQLIHHGRSSSTKTIILCNNCNKKRIEEEKRQAETRRRVELDNMRKRRIHSFVWPTIVALIFIIIAITKFTGGDSKTGGILLGIGLFSFPFLGCWILFNNFVPEMWATISSWSIRFPGVIFTLDLDGLFFLIIVKILFGLISIFISFLAVVFATVLGMAVAVFVYPFALGKNLKGIE